MIVEVNATTVVNMVKETYQREIGRSTIFGNPFIIGVDGNREEVIEKYRVYFLRRVEKDTQFREKVLSLKGKILGCFCKPKACHGDVIAQWLNQERINHESY